MCARPPGSSIWVCNRLIKAEIDDPFDDRFHAHERDDSLRRAPGHISFGVWLDAAWRQMGIIQGEWLEFRLWRAALSSFAFPA